MSPLARLLEKMRPQFEKGGKWSALHPVFAAAEAFFYADNRETRQAPWGREALDLKRYMSFVIVALLPCLAMSVYCFGWRVLALVAVSYAAGGLVEVLFAVFRKEKINEGLLVTGLIFPLTLPPGLPLWIAAVGIAFGVLIGKEIFGGTGRNVFNPALVGRCFLSIGYPSAMSMGWIVPGSGPTGRLFQYVSGTDVHAVTSATPLVAAKDLAANHTGALAHWTAGFLGIEPGCCGETSALAILLGAAVLLVTRVANWRTIAGVLGSYLVFGLVFDHAFPKAFPTPTLWHMLAGGLLFGAVFMATDPVTSPVTNCGKWICGILTGLLTLLIRNLTGYVEGMMFAILLSNIFAPSVDELVLRAYARRIRNEG
jgi:Na(+)-translocating NADH:ubiquinone oxidoreductase B subunit